MNMRVKVKTEKDMELINYYVMRAINDNGAVKAVIAERKCERPPKPEEIACFICETQCDFVSVVSNYYLRDFDASLPFE